MRLDALAPGDFVRLVSFGATPLAYRRRLLALGLTIGASAQMIRRAPLGCPVHMVVRETSLALRKEEASELIWEKI